MFTGLDFKNFRLKRDFFMELNYKDIDMKKAPQVHVTPLYVVANVLSRILAFTSRINIHIDDEVKKLKEPYIVLANHASFTDFIGQIVAFKNRKLCRVVSIEEFYNIGSIQTFTAPLSGNYKLEFSNLVKDELYLVDICAKYSMPNNKVICKHNFRWLFMNE